MPDSVGLPTLILAFLIIAAAVIAIYRRVDVRLCLLVAAMALGLLAGNVTPIIQKFFSVLANEKFVVPICCAMGFAYVLRHTGCDKHLIYLLVNPLKRVRDFLIPGTVLVGFLVNTPIISQTSTVVTLGPVVIPILLAARVSRLTIAATLVLGCSIGGELLNPGAPELQSVTSATSDAVDKMNEGLLPDEKIKIENTVEHCVARIFPLNMLGLLVATSVFWFMSVRAEKNPPPDSDEEPAKEEPSADFRVNYFKAMVPVIPLALLYLMAPPLEVFKVPTHWLVSDTDGLYNTRLIGVAMLVGVVIATLAVPRSAGGVARAFFDGTGYALANIVSLIVTASCFGQGIREIGIANLIGSMIEAMPAILIPAAGFSSLGFAVLSGSGMATTQSLFEFFARPSIELGIDPAHVGAVVSLASAAGRTMSPVAAVVLMSGTLTGTNPFDISKRVALPLIAGVVAIVVAAMLFVPGF